MALWLAGVEPDAIAADHALSDESWAPHNQEWLASARLAHERVVVVNHILPAGTHVPSVRAGKVYLVDARHSDAASVIRTLTEVEGSVQTGHLAVAALTELR